MAEEDRHMGGESEVHCRARLSSTGTRHVKDLGDVQRKEITRKGDPFHAGGLPHSTLDGESNQREMRNAGRSSLLLCFDALYLSRKCIDSAADELDLVFQWLFGGLCTWQRQCKHQYEGHKLPSTDAHFDFRDFRFL